MNRRIADIEVLRGFAILLVLFQHSYFNLLVHPGRTLESLYANLGGWVGVDLFFVISGFVIARDLIPRLVEADGNQTTLSTVTGFWIRRATRLWPSAWLWLLLILLATIVFNKSGAFGSLQANLDATLAGVFNYGNFRFISAFGHFEYGASFPYWSLSLEEQFYLLLPIVVIIFRRRLPALAVLLTLAVLVQFCTNRHFSIFLMGTRSDALLSGVLLAMWSKRESYRRFEPTWLAWHQWLGVAALMGLIIGLTILGSNRFGEFRFSVGLVAMLSTVLVFIASYDKNYLMPGSLFKRIFLWCGSRSYAMYLTHIPAYFAAREIWFRIAPAGTVFDETYNVRLILTAAMLILIFSELNYRFIETPLRIRGKKIVDNLNRRQFQYQT